MTPWNEVDGYRLTASDTVIAALFCKEVEDCLQLGHPDSNSNWDDCRINKCCDLISRWLDVICGESIWFRVCDIDRGLLGNMDFAIVVMHNTGKESLMDEAIRRIQILCQWYKVAIGEHDGTIEIAVCFRSS